MNEVTKLRKAGIVQTVGEILDTSDDDRAARVFAEALKNEPEEDAVEALRKQIDTAYEEAKLWLDGQELTSQEQADDLARILDELTKGYKLAESERVAAKKPHDDAAAAVQALFKPIVDKADKGRKGCDKAIRRWNDHLAELLRIEAQRVRQAAIDAAAEAQRLLDEAEASNDLSAIEVAEQQIDNAAELTAMAKRAEGAKAMTATSGNRIGGSRKVWVGRIDADALDLEAVRAAEHALMSHYWKNRRQWLVDALMDEAQRDIRAGARVIGGLVITQEKVL